MTYEKTLEDGDELIKKDVVHYNNINNNNY